MRKAVRTCALLILSAALIMTLVSCGDKKEAAENATQPVIEETVPTEKHDPAEGYSTQYDDKYVLGDTIEVKAPKGYEPADWYYPEIDGTEMAFIDFQKAHAYSEEDDSQKIEYYEVCAGPATAGLEDMYAGFKTAAKKNRNTKGAQYSQVSTELGQMYIRNLKSEDAEDNKYENVMYPCMYGIIAAEGGFITLEKTTYIASGETEEYVEQSGDDIREFRDYAASFAAAGK